MGLAPVVPKRPSSPSGHGPRRGAAATVLRERQRRPLLGELTVGGVARGSGRLALGWRRLLVQ